MYDDNETSVAVDSRSDKMHQWIDLDNAVKKLETQKVEADMKLSELRPKRDKLGQQISEMVYPSQVPTIIRHSDIVGSGMR